MQFLANTYGALRSRDVAVYRSKLAARNFQARVSIVERRLRSAERALPDLVIIGGQKCGSTSLYSYLADHPRVIAPAAKEVHFFDVNYGRGLDWYRAHFPLRKALDGGQKLTFEASPYYLYHPAAPERTAGVLPGAKLIAILRNPVDRAYSHYWHEHKRGYESLSLYDALAAEERRLEAGEGRLAADPYHESYEHRHFSYLARGRYAEQLRRWLKYYPAEQLLILEAEALFRDPAAEMRRVTAFLGIEECEAAHFKAKNVGAYKAIPAEICSKLEDYFQPYNDELVGRFGLDFSWARSGAT